MTTESRLQQECFTWHWNNFPEEREALFMVYNNPKNAAHGAVLKGMGLIKGVSDLAYIRPDGVTVYIEMKIPGGRQSPTQKNWQRLVESRGGTYYICDNLEDFKAVMAKEMQCNPEHANTTSY